MSKTRFVLGSSVLALALTMTTGAFGQDDAAGADEIDFGDDSGRWANDGVCDDARFTGPGMGVGLQSHIGADATDCRQAHEAGTVTLADEGGQDEPASTDYPIVIDGIDFGDDSGNWAKDGECDDARFTGPGMGAALESHIGADATDCSTAYEAGTVTLAEDGGPDEQASTDYPIIADDIDFGDDSGHWSRDGECDDARFEGPGMGVASQDHVRADATDCHEAYEAGTVTYIGEASAQGDDFRINFGDDSGSSAFDGICDDPRFQGRGAAAELYESNLLTDATDCQAAYEAGTVTYTP